METYVQDCSGGSLIYFFLIFQSVYNGPVQYFARIAKENRVVIEQFDHYLKQTYRNRCRIAGANGPLDLSFPVVNEHGAKTLVKDVRIDNSIPWQKIHLRSIHAAYASAPFFEYIIDDFIHYYEKQIAFLIDLNHGLLESTLSVLGINPEISYTDSFVPVDENGADPRNFIHPKKDIMKFDPDFKPVPYNQVFIDRHGFIPNLSIIDLLFNEGLNARSILDRSLVY